MKLDKENKIHILYGILLSIGLMLVGIYGANIIGSGMKILHIISPEGASPISGIFVAILLGMIIRNTLGVHPKFEAGIAFSLHYMLRAGIILLGLRLSLVEAFTVGIIGLPIIILCITVGFGLTLLLTKYLRQSSRLGLLIGAGTSICGVTAIMATAPVLKAKDNEIAYAVANITIFGVTAMVFYPFIANYIFASDMTKIGLFFGTAIHDTAQVTGAALIYAEMFQADQVINVAAVTKLTRNLFIIVIIPLIAFLGMKGSREDKHANKRPWYHFFPLFIIGFISLSFVRTVGDYMLGQSGQAFAIWHPSAWEHIHTSLSHFGTTYLLGIAMAAVGLSTDFKQFKGIGFKPFLIGFIAAIAVGIVSVVMVFVVHAFI